MAHWKNKAVCCHFRCFWVVVCYTDKD